MRKGIPAFILAETGNAFIPCFCFVTDSAEISFLFAEHPV